MMPDEIHGYELTTGDTLPAEYVSPDRRAKITVRTMHTQQGEVLSCTLYEAERPHAYDEREVSPTAGLVAQRLCEDLPETIKALDERRERKEEA